MCPGNCPEILKPGLYQKFHCSNPVKQKPYGKDPDQPGIGKVFIQENEIIPEIQVGFSPGDLWQGSPSNMEDSRIWTVHDLVPGIVHPPAKINFFHMSEEILIKTTQFVINF